MVGGHREHKAAGRIFVEQLALLGVARKPAKLAALLGTKGATIGPIGKEIDEFRAVVPSAHATHDVAHELAKGKCDGRLPTRGAHDGATQALAVRAQVIAHDKRPHGVAKNEVRDVRVAYLHVIAHAMHVLSLIHI